MFSFLYSVDLIFFLVYFCSATALCCVLMGLFFRGDIQFCQGPHPSLLLHGSTCTTDDVILDRGGGRGLCPQQLCQVKEKENFTIPDVLKHVFKIKILITKLTSCNVFNFIFWRF